DGKHSNQRRDPMSIDPGMDLPPYAPAADRYDRMPYRRCGRGGLQLPAISLGKLLVFAAIFGVLFGGCSAFLYQDIGLGIHELKRAAARFAAAASLALVALLLLVFWGTWAYHLCVIQTIAILTLDFYIVNSIRFNTFLMNDGQ
ncbi:MAG: hypothetical protein Q8P67_26400, partial [archaeon]|nr:hypothetical protein [archaeon]